MTNYSIALFQCVIACGESGLLVIIKQKETVDMLNNFKEKIGSFKVITGNFQMTTDALITSTRSTVEIDFEVIILNALTSLTTK